MDFLNKGGIPIEHVSQNKFYKELVYDRQDKIASNVNEAWEGLITHDQIEEIKRLSNIRTISFYPLVSGNEVFAVLQLDFNRDYETLNSFEKSSIRNFINIVALMLDKAYLYKNLQESYEVTKKAYAVEKQAKEDLENLDKTKNEFMMVTQHHLRTPLTSMMGYMDLIEGGAYGEIPENIKDIIHKFGAASQDLIKIVNEFLDASQFQLGKKVIAPILGVNIETIVKGIVDVSMITAKNKGIVLEFQEVGDAIPLIEADASKLQVALTNIIDNAVKYTKQGSVSVTMSKKGNMVEIISKDTGIGMEKATIDSLFTSLFSRGREAKSSNTTGSGVGLYLSAKIIQAHNGKIWAESEGKDKGSTFHIELPINQPQEASNNQPKK
jgi:signal transduction histidine kinase